MKKKVLIYSSIAIFMLTTLVNGKKTDKANNPKAEPPINLQNGEKIYTQACITCHSNTKGNDRLAPPFIGVKWHYIEKNMSEASFVKEISNFLISPSIEKSKMPGAVRKFGLMPNLGLSKEDYEAVAAYIYRAELKRPGWSEKKNNTEQNSLKVDNNDYLEKGKKIALSTKKLLGKNLFGSIQEKGTEGAIEFCNEKAIPLTDTKSKEFDTKIKRVSDKNRNPNNKANDQELNYINKAKLDLKNGLKISPKVFEHNNKVVGYYPIIANQMCMQCHGKPKTGIKTNTLKVIKELYPEDKATGYSVNELRGLWVIEMNKK